MSITLEAQIYEALPFLKTASDQFLSAFQEQARRHQVPAGKVLYWEGDHCTALPIALSGQFRVFKTGENGSEITLYRFTKGESCILTTSCIFGKGNFPAVAKVEIAGEVLLVAANTVRLWMNTFPEWQQYLCSLFGRRLADTIALVEEVTFKGMDKRLIRLLLHRTENDQSQIDLTHQKIAYELGTAREVISRILKDLEMQGILALSRGHIKIVDRSALENLLKPGQM